MQSSPSLHMTQLLDENLLSISSYLSLQDVRTLASTCHSVRDTLTASQGARTEIWFNRMQEKFPAIFVPTHSPCTSLRGAIDDNNEGQVSKSSLSFKNVDFVDKYTGTSVNLPLVASLLPRRYPQTVDLTNSNQEKDEGHDFRSCMMSISAAQALTSIHEEDQHPQVPVIQYAGEVGTGDRSIRSKEPFPASCRKLSPSTAISKAAVSSWVKKRNPGVRIEKKVKSLKLRLKRSSVHSFDATNLASTHKSHQHSSLLPLHPSLSRQGTDTSAYSDESMIDTSSLKGGIRKNAQVNNKHGGNLRPFVTPTVISRSRNLDYSQCRLLVDVTPRFAAYFEVTIMTQPQGSTALSHENKHESEQNHHECVAIGLSTQAFASQDKMPGWDSKSYGYHGDDGKMFHEGKSHHDGPSFGPGDTVGCGLDYSSRRVFFTKNGTYLDYEFDKVGNKVVDEGLYPTVGVDSKCPMLVNFGEHPFKFDLKRFC